MASQRTQVDEATKEPLIHKNEIYEGVTPERNEIYERLVRLPKLQLLSLSMICTRRGHYFFKGTGFEVDITKLDDDTIRCLEPHLIKYEFKNMRKSSKFNHLFKND